jgi:hypothetical protein
MLIIGAHTKSNCRLSSMTISREIRKKGKKEGKPGRVFPHN